MGKDEALKIAFEALESADWYIDQLEMIVYSVDDDGTHENRAKVQAAITAIKEVLSKPAPPPPECKTEAEQTAYAFGWWKALESARTEQPQQRQPLTVDEVVSALAKYPLLKGIASIDRYEVMMLVRIVENAHKFATPATQQTQEPVDLKEQARKGCGDCSYQNCEYPDCVNRKATPSQKKPQQAYKAICKDESYDMIDRFLRNNLYDDDYESFSEALHEIATTPQQQEPRNFCPRCGKRTADLTVIHTCTPPEGGHQ